jgi:hypothetical protein
MSMTKKEKLLLAKKEKKVKLQKATECYKEGIEKYHRAKTREEYEEAAESYTIAISLRPNNPKYYFSRYVQCCSFVFVVAVSVNLLISLSSKGKLLQSDGRVPERLF